MSIDFLSKELNENTDVNFLAHKTAWFIPKSFGNLYDTLLLKFEAILFFKKFNKHIQILVDQINNLEKSVERDMFAHTRIQTKVNFAQRFKEERINLKMKQDERKKDKMLEIEVKRKVFKKYILTSK